MDSTIPSDSTRRLVVLGAVCVAALALPLAFSGGAVATPAIARDLGGGPVAMNWITNAFMLAFGSLLMAAGTLADRFGRKRVFAWGVTGFTLSSLALGFAPSILAVDALRALQGVAAAAALAGGTAALAQEFEGAARTRAFSALGTTFGIGLAFGPLLAGGLIAHLGWRAIFATGALAGALSLAFGVPRMRESRDPHARRLDWAGTLTFTTALTCFTCAVIEAPSRGWTSPPVLALLAACILFGLAFVAVEMRATRPMLDLSLFRYPRFVGVQVLPVATCYCYVVLLVVLPLRFIGIDGHDEMHAGWLMLALSAPMLFVPFMAAALARRFSAGTISGIGLCIAAAALYMLGETLSAGVNSAALGAMVAIGAGAGLPWGLMDGLSVSVVPKSRAGMATGIFSTTRVAGEGIALAVVSAVLAAFVQAHLHGQCPEIPSAALADASARLATGDLAHAAANLPNTARAALLASYQASFEMLLRALSIITLLCALAVFAFLSRVRAHDASESAIGDNRVKGSQ
ncbi:MFS transporter [Trinickia caryophylli]|uniref:Major Facilitator Superfamily protein n=1 Tax=Trinickia caryophylli TaxID=28094 RepID=A0A1X7GEK0_TRICW|nr:MFS transporter [Trinickia caryophylli]PMS10763.1 MFS transporter [Trinickia caryophylli]TRX13860.1 MFS transporter [Trinickia caryophylli]WQE15451.1 MFS transporter [Trinickia caryophylli]SMF68526.1 Major Facilitator Superfamily protein [Trinickia caryophylli]GLU33809.1 MFS transporter [Trinickia caryophylli]